MRHILLSLFFILAASLPAFAADTELNLKGDQIFLSKDGQSTPLDQEMFPAQPITDTDMRFVGLSPDNAEEYGLEPGLYLFKGDGPAVNFAKTNEAEFCADVKFSPDNKIMAMDAGMSLVRDWFFFSYPNMLPFGTTGYYQTPDNPTLIWVGPAGALVSAMELDDHNRACEYDPCGPVSVVYYDIARLKKTTLLAGTDLCDYTLTGLAEDGTATASELCLAAPQDWATFPDGTGAKTVTVKIP